MRLVHNRAGFMAHTVYMAVLLQKGFGMPHLGLRE